MAKGYKILAIEPLPEDEALNTGVDIMSEVFLLVLAASILVFEYARSEANSAAKAALAAKQEQEFRAMLDDRFREADRRLLEMEGKLGRIEEAIAKQREAPPQPQRQEDAATWWALRGWLPSLITAAPVPAAAIAPTASS